MNKNAQYTMEIHDTKMQLVEQLKAIKDLNEDHNIELSELKEEHNKKLVEKDFAFLEGKKQLSIEAENRLYERIQQLQENSDLKLAEVQDHRDRIIDDLNKQLIEQYDSTDRKIKDLNRQINELHS